MGAIYLYRICLFLIDGEQATCSNKWLTLMFSKAMQKILNLPFPFVRLLSLNNFTSRGILLALAQLLVTSWIHVKTQRMVKLMLRVWESAKLRAPRAKNVLTCQRVLHAYMLTCQRVLCAYVLTCYRVLCAYVLTCQHALRALRAHVPTSLACFACLRAHVI